jgi:hypothetical protein
MGLHSRDCPRDRSLTNFASSALMEVRPGSSAPNKRTAILENLRVLPAAVQYQVISELCDRASQSEQAPAIAELKLMLASRYSHLSSDGGNTWTGSLTVEARHWLDTHPNVKKLYVEALQKHRAGVYLRNALDDLRLALELLAQETRRMGGDTLLPAGRSELGHLDLMNLCPSQIGCDQIAAGSDWNAVWQAPQAIDL